MYTNWKIGDNVGIGVNVAEFCGFTSQFIFINSYDMELSPTVLSLPCLVSGCNTKTCIDVNGRQVNFFSCMTYSASINDVNCGNVHYTKYYRQLWSTNTDNNGDALFTHVVTAQDLADYNDAIGSGGVYNIVACINDSLATKAHATNFGNITVTCPTCPPICVGNDLYNQVCDQSTGNCIQGSLLQSGGCTPGTGIIYFDSNPQGAEIWLAPSPNAPTDTSLQTPHTISNVTPGAYNYILKVPNYDNYSGTVNILAGQTVSVYGQLAPWVNYELYFKVSEIIPSWLIYSILGSVYSEASNLITDFTGYYIGSVAFDPTTYIITIAVSRYTTLSGGYENVQSLEMSMTDIHNIAGELLPIVMALLGFIIAGPIGAIILGAVTYAVVTFFGIKQSVVGQPPSTRAITLTAEICTGTATNPCATTNSLTSETVLITLVAGDSTQTGSITASSPSATFSVPTNVRISISAKVKDNPYYAVFTADPQSNPELESCTPGSSCPTTIPIVIKLFAQADAKTAPGLTDTSGNSLPGKYTLYIEDSRGFYVEDGSGNLINGKVPQTVIPANKEYCILIIPADYPTHDKVFTCSSCSAGEICTPVLPSQTCTEEKNSVTVRCVYISSSGARLGFTPDEIDITDMSTNTVRKILPGTPTQGSTCPGVITSDTTCINGLDNGKTYKIHVVSSTYTVTATTQDQQVSYTTDCNTGILLLVEASPPPNTYDITVQVINSQTLTALPGAIATLGTMPAETTDASGTVMFPSVPQGTGIPLKVTLTGYKDYSTNIDITSTKTITVHMDVNQVLATVETRISNFNPSGTVAASQSIAFKGHLEYLSDTTYSPLTDAPITVTVEDKSGNTIQTLSATTQAGIGIIGAGDFETGQWLVPANLLNTQITVTATFAGVGRYKSSTFSTTYVVVKAVECVIPIPFTSTCLLSKDTAKTLLILGGLVIGGYVVYKAAKLIPSKKEPSRKEVSVPTGRIFEIKPVE